MKNLCYDRAKKLKIAHAQIPKGKYLAEMTSRKILTVNHVYDILLKWAESKDWAAAISTVMVCLFLFSFQSYTEIHLSHNGNYKKAARSKKRKLERRKTKLRTVN